MQVYTHKTGFPENMRGGVVAIGNFDGVHKGHQVLINSAIQKAKALGKPCGILSFSPHPRRFFNPDSAPFRLTSIKQKARVLKSLGVDFVAIEAFDRELSSLSPLEFVTKILVEKYGFSFVVAGFNFYFGAKRAGNADDLMRMAKENGIDVMIQDEVKSGDRNYSSSSIRDYIREGEFAPANEMLGWRWEIEGEVLHGDKRGRELGYPTANQSLKDYLRPPYGVYAVRASLKQDHLKPGKWYHGVANLGIRPMFEVDEPLLETCIFDFNDDIYGQNLRVQPVMRLRGEQYFPNVEDLMEQMKRDELAARRILENYNEQISV